MKNDSFAEYERWLRSAADDKELVSELRGMDGRSVEDAFYRNLSFGTGGLRGVIGAGTNRMNIYTVAKASQGLADYLTQHYSLPSAVIGYDSRIKSDVFARVTAGVLAANGIKVHIWAELLPVPTVSFAVRYLGASAGVLITASHNPCRYNGYKVYGEDGCQITTEAAAEILDDIEKLDVFADVKSIDFGKGLKNGKIAYIPDEVLTAYIEEVKRQSVLGEKSINKDISIVYSPLNGTGLKPVTRALYEMGFSNVRVVEEQKYPDGNFPTCPYPNPEIKEALALGLKCARDTGSDLVLATDPDCDRVGVAARNREGELILLSGNETGILLLDYICARRTETHTMPLHPVMIKTIVTTDLGERIASHYGVRTVNVLTGFKFIGEQIGRLERQGNVEDFVFGFEESYGYLSGPYVRDKDGVNAACLICEMFAYYASQGICLPDRLESLYNLYGWNLNSLHTFEFEGVSGSDIMQRIMAEFRENTTELCGNKILSLQDYSVGLDGLPKADVIKFLLERNASVVVRPSGTEPKLKTYISVSAGNWKEAKTEEAQIADSLKSYFAAFS